MLVNISNNYDLTMLQLNNKYNVKYILYFNVLRQKEFQIIV